MTVERAEEKENTQEELQSEVLGRAVDEEEVLLQSFAMDHPGVDPKAGDISRTQFEIAHRSLNFTDDVDKEFGVLVNDDNKENISRDTLARYKTLVFRAQLREYLALENMKDWRIIAIGAVIVVVGFIAFQVLKS